ncbi:MAG: ubiquinol-cytochrome C chaperone family protein [Rhodovibrionaceae bacterium]
MKLREKLSRVFPNNPQEDKARALYVALVAQARQPAFYARLGVPDSVDGRFEMLILHCYLVLRRLRAAQPKGQALAQTLFDTLIYDMDQSIRESGVGDLKVGPRLRQMAEAFYGRIKAYDAGLAEEGPALEAALRRNLYGTAAEFPESGPAEMAGYLRWQDAALSEQATAALLCGEIAFAPPPEA